MSSGPVNTTSVGMGTGTISANAWGSTSISINAPNYASIHILPDGETLTFNFKGSPLVTIHRDGKIDKHPTFTTDDETSLKFWEILMDTFDIAWWRGLVKRR